MDDGSTLTLMEESVANELDERGTASPLCLAWTGEVRRNEPQSRRLNLKISKQCQGAKMFQLKEVHTVKSLGMSAETMEAEKKKMLYPHLKGLPLPSYVKVVPQIIIGVNNPNFISSLKKREGKWQQPIAAKTRLGWTAYGGSRRSEGLHASVIGCVALGRGTIPVSRGIIPAKTPLPYSCVCCSLADQRSTRADTLYRSLAS
ncbi:hypothetical protein ACLKA7_012122 [Drosophila subpalustris]